MVELTANSRQSRAKTPSVRVFSGCLTKETSEIESKSAGMLTQQLGYKQEFNQMWFRSKSVFSDIHFWPPREEPLIGLME